MNQLSGFAELLFMIFSFKIKNFENINKYLPQKKQHQNFKI